MSWPRLDNSGELEIPFWTESDPIPVFRILPTEILYPELGADAGNQVGCDFLLHVEELVKFHDHGIVETRPAVVTHHQVGSSFFIRQLRQFVEIFENGEYLRGCDYELSIPQVKIRVQSRPTGRPAALMDVTLYNAAWLHRESTPATIARCIFNLDASRISQAITGWHMLLRRLSSMSD